MPKLPLDTGVYCILNLVNQKRYVGSATRSLRSRMAGHRKMLRERKHHNRYLQATWSKHGEKAFKFYVLDRCEPELCLAAEQKRMDEFQSYRREFGYNISPTAGNTKGVKYPPEHCARLSLIVKEAHARPEVKAKRAAIMNDPEYKARHAVSMRKVLDSPEYRQRMSESCRVAQQRPEVKARVLAGLRAAMATKEYRDKQRIASTGRKHSEETKQKIRASNTPEVRYRKGSSNRGKKLSEATRARMSGPKAAEARRNMAIAAKRGWIKRRQTMAARLAAS